MTEEEELPFGAEPLTAEEEAAKNVAKGCIGDWGPVFVYGSMLFPTAWSDLTDRLPEMRSATLRGYERRCFTTGGFAGLFEQKAASVVGMLVSGLTPKERLLLDAVVDDSFLLVDAMVEPTGDSEARLLVYDCGASEFNGRYIPDGTEMGRVRYQSEHKGANGLLKTIWWEDGYWHFGENYKGYWYKADWDGKTAPLECWTIDTDGVTPLPLIKREPVQTECSMYILREKCMDALGDEDWDFEKFGEECLPGYTALCRDTLVAKADEKLDDLTLKDLALARRRRATGYEDEGEEKKKIGEQDLEDDPDAVDPRLGIVFVVGILRLNTVIHEDHLHDESWCRVPVEPSETTGRTPQEEFAHLEAIGERELAARRKTKGSKYPMEPALKDPGNLIQQMREGIDIRFNEIFRDPLIKSGFRATRSTDFVIVSAPCARYDWYVRIVVLCALFRIGLNSVSELHFGDLWLWVWKRNVDRMVKEKKALVVLSCVEQYGGGEIRPGCGKIEFSQAVQILYLKQKGYPFVVIDSMYFSQNLMPALTNAAANKFDTVEQTIMGRRSLPVPLSGVVDGSGRTMMHYAAMYGPSERLMRMLYDLGEDANARQWDCDEHGAGWTPLHYAAKMGPPRMIRLLAEANADFHTKNQAGKTPMDLARGRREAERMMSQCHWKLCGTCNAPAEEGADIVEKKPPTPPPADPVQDMDPAHAAQVHALDCVLCSRFT